MTNISAAYSTVHVIVTGNCATLKVPKKVK